MLPYEADMLAVMAEHDELARALLDPTEAEQVKAGEALRRTVAELHEMRGQQARVEEALRISEERLKAVLRATRMAFWVWDPPSDIATAPATRNKLRHASWGGIGSTRRGFERAS
jgi:PAS domain-containing protein